MAKFSKQFRQRFLKKQVRPEVNVYDMSVCVSLDGVTKQVAEEVGNELANMRICESYVVEWNGQNDLWLYEFDFALMPMTEFTRTLSSLLEMFDYDVIDVIL